MFQVTLGIDLFICNWYINLVTSLLLSVLLLLPMLTKKCQPVFELSMIEYFVCCVCTRLARQKATWYVTALTVPQVLNTRIAPLEGPCACSSRCYWMGWFFIGPAVAACAFGILFYCRYNKPGSTRLFQCPSIYPYMPSSAAEGIAPVLCHNTWCLVLVSSWLFPYV